MERMTPTWSTGRQNEVVGERAQNVLCTNVYEGGRVPTRSVFGERELPEQFFWKISSTFSGLLRIQMQWENFSEKKIFKILKKLKNNWRFSVGEVYRLPSKANPDTLHFFIWSISGVCEKQSAFAWKMSGQLQDWNRGTKGGRQNLLMFRWCRNLVRIL